MCIERVDDKGSVLLVFIQVQWLFRTLIYIVPKGSFNNYLEKKEEGGVSTKSTLGHVAKGMYHVKCVKYTQFSTRGGRGSKLGKIWST